MATDFFQRQDAARRTTGRLVFFLLAGLLTLIGLTYVLIMLVWNGLGKGQVSSRLADLPVEAHWWNLQIFLWVTLFTSLVVLGGSFVRTMQLRASGGAGVAQSMGGHEVMPGSADPDERKLLNIVEEMAIASSMPMPRVFVMDDESGINAFAAGWTQQSAVIGVTRGAIAGLSRDELQGVIAHEFSHILNGDMRMNIRLMGLVFGLLALTVIGRVLLQVGFYSSSSRDSKKGDPRAALALIGLVLLVMGYVGAFFGQLMQAAISRQREYLADASAVQFTRNAAGLAGALKQIGASGARMRSSHADEASHMFFGATTTPFMGLLATHPPLEERIRRLDPAWDGTLPAPRLMQGRRGVAYRADGAPVQPARPSGVAAGVNGPKAAAAIACALLLDRRNAQVRAAQTGGDASLDAAGAQVLHLGEEARLAALEECLPALGKLAPQERAQVLAQVETVLEKATAVGLQEWALHRILKTVLSEPAPVTGKMNLAAVGGQAALALSVLARAGSRNQWAIRRAFAAGAVKLDLPKDALVSAEMCRFPDLDKALDALRQLADTDRQRMMIANVAVANGDGRLTPLELLLMRAYGLSLAV